MKVTLPLTTSVSTMSVSYALDFASLTAIADVFFPRIWRRRATMTPIGTVSMTIYFHAVQSQLQATGSAYLLGLRVRRMTASPDFRADVVTRTDTPVTLEARNLRGKWLRAEPVAAAGDEDDLAAQAFGVGSHRVGGGVGTAHGRLEVRGVYRQGGRRATVRGARVTEVTCR